MQIKIDPLDRLTSEYIRKKSKGYCAKCGRYFGWQKLQACHFFGRRHRSTRYDEENICPLCFSCHQHFHENPLEFVEWFKARLGDRFELLQARARITYPKPDKEAIGLYLKAKIEEIADEEIPNNIC